MSKFERKAQDSVLVGCWNLLASEYTRWNCPAGKAEDAATRNRRWAQTVRELLRTAPDVCAAQEVSRDFLAYAFAGVLPLAAPASPGAAASDAAAAAAEADVAAAAGGLAADYEFVWVRRTFPAANQVLGGKPDGSAVFFRKSRFAPPALAKAAAADEPTTLTSAQLIAAESKAKPNGTGATGAATGTAPASAGASAPMSVFAPTHFAKLKSAGDPRNAVAVALADAKSGAVVGTYVCVHLEGAWGATALRTEQLAEACKGAAALPVKSPFTLVCGDFNEDNLPAVSAALKPFGLAFVPTAAPASAAAANAGGAAAAAGGGAAAPAAPHPDTFTSIFGAIDHVYVSDAKRVAGPVRIVPAPAERKRKAAGDSAKSSVSGAPDSPYVDPPYHDSAWPSDHYLLLLEVSAA